MEVDLNSFSLSTKEYLEEHDVLFYMEDAVTQLLEQKDENPKIPPLKFLADYFRSVHNGAHTLFREYSFLQATSKNRRHFIKSVWSSFRHVSSQGADLLSVKEYHSLVSLLCYDFPLDVIQKTARIVLMDDALDCLMSFVDFLFAFQIQVYYEEFVTLTKDAYDYLLLGHPPVVVPSSDSWNSVPTLAASNPLSSGDRTSDNGVDSDLLYEAIKKVCAKMARHAPKPALELIAKELAKSRAVTFHSLLMSLSKSHAINREINILPHRDEVFEGADNVQLSVETEVK